MTAHSASREFRLDVSAPADIRRFVRAQLHDWQLAELCDVAELLVSEVVTNSIRHAFVGGSVEITQVAPTVVRVEVSDEGAGLPVPRQAGPTDVAGRGLAIVGALATDWGVAPHVQAGKTVWFELKL